MTTITPEVAEKLAESWALHRQYRAHFGGLLCDYLEQFEDEDERLAESMVLTEIAVMNVDPVEVAEDRAARLYAAQETQARH